VADALAHQDTPMDDLRRAYGARGSLPFDVIFHAAQRPHPVLNLPAGKAVPIPEYQPSGRELVAEMWPEPDGAVLLVVHQPAGSDPAVAERIAEHWSVALCGYGAAAL
jgi:hypothetical protein